MDCDRKALTRLVGRCPFEGAPAQCALAAARGLAPRQQLEWLRELSDAQIAELCYRHSVCPCNSDTKGSGVFDDA